MTLPEDLARLNHGELVEVLGLTIQRLGTALREIQDECERAETIGYKEIPVVRLRRIIAKTKGM
jgi:hypothetical protein